MMDPITELEGILRRHAAQYPQMQPTDAVKLIYQNEFGGGHLIADEEKCIQYLKREFADTVKDPQLPRYDEIGNGIVRAHLAAIKEDDLQALGSAFIRSAAEHKGSFDRFLQKLDVLRTVTRQDVFSFDEAALEDYLASYAAKGYPPVSHSEAFRAAYHPAYRVVLLQYLP